MSIIGMGGGLRARKQCKSQFPCVDGPLAGKVLLLASSPTLDLLINGQAGRYVKRGLSNKLSWESK